MFIKWCSNFVQLGRNYFYRPSHHAHLRNPAFLARVEDYCNVDGCKNRKNVEMYKEGLILLMCTVGWMSPIGMWRWRPFG